MEQLSALITLYWVPTYTASKTRLINIDLTRNLVYFGRIVENPKPMESFRKYRIPLAKKHDAWYTAMEAKKEDGPFTCCCCGEFVVLKKGSKRAHHFSHAKDSKCTASHESMQHKYAKHIIVSKLSKFAFRCTCLTCQKVFVRRWLETDGFTATEELRCMDGGYILDVGIKDRDGGTVAALEVCHTHPIGQVKRGKLELHGISVVEVSADSVIATYERSGHDATEFEASDIKNSRSLMQCPECEGLAAKQATRRLVTIVQESPEAFHYNKTCTLGHVHRWCLPKERGPYVPGVKTAKDGDLVKIYKGFEIQILTNTASNLERLRLCLPKQLVSQANHWISYEKVPRPGGNGATNFVFELRTNEEHCPTCQRIKDDARKAHIHKAAEEERLRQALAEKAAEEKRLRQEAVEKERLRRFAAKAAEDVEKEKLRQAAVEENRLRQIAAEEEKNRQALADKAAEEERRQKAATDEERRRQALAAKAAEEKSLRQVFELEAAEKERLRQVAVKEERDRQTLAAKAAAEERRQKAAAEEERVWHEKAARAANPMFAPCVTGKERCVLQTSGHYTPFCTNVDLWKRAKKNECVCSGQFQEQELQARILEARAKAKPSPLDTAFERARQAEIRKEREQLSRQASANKAANRKRKQQEAEASEENKQKRYRYSLREIVKKTVTTWLQAYPRTFSEEHVSCEPGTVYNGCVRLQPSAPHDSDHVAFALKEFTAALNAVCFEQGLPATQELADTTAVLRYRIVFADAKETAE